MAATLSFLQMIWIDPPYHHPVKYFVSDGPPLLHFNMNSLYPIASGHTPFTLYCVRMFYSSQLVYSGTSVLILDLQYAKKLGV